MKLIDQTVNQFIASKFETNNSNSTVENEIKFHFENQTTSNYKTEEKKLRNIVDQHISIVDPHAKIKLQIY